MHRYNVDETLKKMGLALKANPIFKPKLTQLMMIENIGRKIIILLIGGVASTSIVITLYFLSIHPVTHGTFTRLVPTHSLDIIKDIILPPGRYDFAGNGVSPIYVIRQNQPTTLVEVSEDLSNYKLDSLRIEGSSQFYSLQTIAGTDRKIFLCDGAQSLILETTLPQTLLLKSKLQTPIFFKSCLVKNNQFILEKYDSLHKQNVYIKPAMQRQGDTPTYMPQKNGDGVFSTDGMMNYCASNALLAFVYYYNSRFDCLDSNLQKKFAAKTIDAGTVASLNIYDPGQGSKYLIRSKSKIINGLSATADNRLYISSGILSKNEPSDLLNKCSVIDVYSLTDGRYIQSLYAYHYLSTPLSAFLVRGNTLIALFENHLAFLHIKRVRSDDTAVKASQGLQ